MRACLSLLFAGLTAALLLVPTRAEAGSYGCASGYYRPSYGVGGGYGYSYPAGYYPATYSPTYYAPTYAPSYTAPTPNTCVDTPAGTVCNHGYGAGTYGGFGSQYSDVLYRIAPDLAQARLAQEAATATVAQFKTELAKQAVEAEAKADRQANRDFQQQMIQLLAQRPAAGAGAPPSPAGGAYQAAAGPDPATAAAIGQLQADNAAIKAALERIAAGMAARTAPPPDQLPEPPAPSRAATAAPPAGPTKAPPEVLAAAGKAFAANCTRCHKPGSGRLDLTAPERLTYEDLSDCVVRMISNNPKTVMPKDKPPASVAPEAVGAVHDLLAYAPRRK